MIVSRKEFKKFWKFPWNLPDIVFCNENYYLPTLEELESKIIPIYQQTIEKYNLKINKNWDCSKFANTFKLICDIYNKDKNDDTHFAVSIAHIEIKESKYDHALNLIFYKNENNIDYIFFEPQSLDLYKDKKKFKNLKFLYF
jgi:hypothetical protein